MRTAGHPERPLVADKRFSRIVSLNNFGLLGQFYSERQSRRRPQGNVTFDRAVFVATMPVTVCRASIWTGSSAAGRRYGM